MELSSYIEELKTDLKAAAAPGGKEVSEAAELLSTALEPSVRLTMLEALSDASAEITAALEDASVEARLRGREVDFVVEEATHEPVSPAQPEDAPTDQSSDIARISLRLPESLKEAVESRASMDNISVNSWLVRAIAAEVGRGARFMRPGGSKGRASYGKRLTGFAKA